MMSPLTTEQLVVLVKLLDAQERSLVAVIDEHVVALHASRTPEMSPLLGDIADLAEIEQVHNRQLVTVDHDQQALRDIEAASARVAAGSVNSCIDCDEEIGFQRLLAHPTATRCVFCQDLYEQTHRWASNVMSGRSI